MNHRSPPPAYFIVDRPAHFRVRPDLIEELCIPEMMRATLPKNGKQYPSWLRAAGLTADECPFAKIPPLLSRAYEPTLRYILRPMILRGEKQISNHAVDARGFAVLCETGGLWDFVVNRAIEFAGWKGLDAAVARGMLVPSIGKDVATHDTCAAWTIGYERETGLCTLLARDHGETETLFLARKGGYYTPFPEIPDPNL